MIRCSNISLKFSNKEKKNNIKLFIQEYTSIVRQMIDILWELDNIPSLIPKELTSKIDTWLSVRIIQCASKQASSIVRGTKKKNSQREYQYNKLIEENKYKQARKLLVVIDKNKESKPKIDVIYPELDYRFVKIDLFSNTSFDGWITLSSLGNKQKIILPFKRTKHFNKMMKTGQIKPGLRLYETGAFINFELPDKFKNEGNVLGIDVGINNIYTCSDNQTSKEDIHGWTLDKIQSKMSKKKKGSKNFHKVQNHRKNYINWSINQINLENVKEVRIEKIKDLRRGVKNSRFMNSWTYPLIFNKIINKCQELGVQVLETSPAYTSQRCSLCGWVRKTNRNGKLFKCTKCGFVFDADLNASINISLNLLPISKKKRLSHDNIVGFYWPEISKECIVPYT